MLSIVDLPRAGFWRRFSSFLINSLIVFVPMGAVGAILFAVSGGIVQMQNGLYRYCKAAAEAPANLVPLPPKNYNEITICRASFFGAQTGGTLILGQRRWSKDARSNHLLFQSYMLDKVGNPIKRLDIDWVSWLFFAAYLIAMVNISGQTLGARLVRIVVVNSRNSSEAGVPLFRCLARYAAMNIGFIPILAILLYNIVIAPVSNMAFISDNQFAWLIFAVVFNSLWVLTQLVLMARKRDPIYDRLAGTAVLRV